MVKNAGSGLAAVQHLRRYNAAQAGSTGAGDLAGASGEVDAGLAGRLGAVLRVLHWCMHSAFATAMVAGLCQCSAWGGRTQHRWTAQAQATSLMYRAFAGRLGAVFCAASMMAGLAEIAREEI